MEPLSNLLALFLFSTRFHGKNWLHQLTSASAAVFHITSNIHVLTEQLFT